MRRDGLSRAAWWSRVSFAEDGRLRIISKSSVDVGVVEVAEHGFLWTGELWVLSGSKGCVLLGGGVVALDIEVVFWVAI